MTDEHDPNVGGELRSERGGFGMLPERVMDDASHGAQALYARLALMAHRGDAWPGVVWLAHKLRSSPRTVRRWCAELRDLEALAVEPRWREDGSQTSNRYIVRWPPPRSHVTPPPVTHDRPPRSPVTAPLEDTKLMENPPSPPEGGASLVRDVVEAWRAALHPRARPSAARDRKVRQRLAEGYTVEELVEAIYGCKGSQFHRDNAHTDLTLICRDGPHVDRFRALYAQQRQQATGARGSSPAGPRLSPDEEALRDLEAWIRLHPQDSNAHEQARRLRQRIPPSGGA